MCIDKQSVLLHCVSRWNVYILQKMIHGPSNILYIFVGTLYIPELGEVKIQMKPIREQCIYDNTLYFVYITSSNLCCYYVTCVPTTLAVTSRFCACSAQST